MKIKRYKYPLTVMIFISALGIIGIAIISFVIVSSIKLYKMEGLFACIQLLSLNIFTILMGLFFVIMSLYVWKSYILNVVVKPKKDILFLNKIEKKECEFIDKTGKAFYFKNKNYILNKYYNVLRTHDNIVKVIDESNKPFEKTKEKIRYWWNFYSINGNFENILLLPLAYLGVVPGIELFIMAPKFKFFNSIFKIYGVFIIICSLSIILYDLIYKIKLNRNENKDVFETNMKIFYFKFLNILQFVFLMMFLIAIIFSAIAKSKILFVPILLGIIYNIIVLYLKSKK